MLPYVALKYKDFNVLYVKKNGIQPNKFEDLTGITKQFMN